MTLPPAGWYPNPEPSVSGLRYWDGVAWTEHYHDAAQPAPKNAVAPRPAPAASAEPKNLLGGLARRFKATPSPQASVQPPTVEAVLAQVQLEAPRHPLEEQVEVVGEQFNVKGIRRVFAECSMPITAAGVTLDEVQIALMPEPWNPHDPNAVAVLVGPHPVGHLPAELARAYAQALGRLAASGYLATGVARIWAKDEGSGMIRARVTALIPETKRF